MRRIVSVWLPDWPITVWSKAARPTPPEPPPATPFALTERTGRGLVLHAVNPAARALGLQRGQNHADACAIVPELASAPAEPERDAEALRRLALWAERFSPAVAVDAQQSGYEGLTLDMTGGAHLFGGEGALLQEIERRLSAAGILARAAIADTSAAAWALARFADDRIAPEGRAREALKSLPVQALRLSDDALKLLHRFGLRRIGDLYALPRAGLARRFRGEEGMELVRRLDQALGIEAEALEPVRPQPLYRVWRAFAEPIIDIEGVGWALPALIEALAAQLGRGGKGARRLVLTAFRVDGRTTSIEAGLSAPVATPAHLLRLLKERGLERLDLGFGADALMVSAHKTEALSARQGDLDGGRERGSPEALAALIDRLGARLGEDAVVRPVLVDSHLPERSEAWIPAGADPAAQMGEADDRPRPLFLLDPPEPIQTLAGMPDTPPAQFSWRRVTRKIARAEGPERLAPEWWRAPALRLPEPTTETERAERIRLRSEAHELQDAGHTRDYYRVEDEDGRRYWLFRQGLYDRGAPDQLPTWWLHGVFA
jgi:protein ImuB